MARKFKAPKLRKNHVRVSTGFMLLPVPEGRILPQRTAEQLANLHALLRVAKGIIQDRLHMDVSVGQESCGTVACLLGWAGDAEYFHRRGLTWGRDIYSNRSLVYRSPSEPTRPVETVFITAGRELFGLNKRDSEALFMLNGGVNWLGGYYSRHLGPGSERDLFDSVLPTLQSKIPAKLKALGLKDSQDLIVKGRTTFTDLELDITLHMPKQVVIENIKRVIDGRSPFLYRQRVKLAKSGETPDIKIPATIRPIR